MPCLACNNKPVEEARLSAPCAEPRANNGAIAEYRPRQSDFKELETFPGRKGNLEGDIRSRPESSSIDQEQVNC
jgi:hypothetical protein